MSWSNAPTWKLSAAMVISLTCTDTSVAQNQRDDCIYYCAGAQSMEAERDFVEQLKKPHIQPPSRNKKTGAGLKLNNAGFYVVHVRWSNSVQRDRLEKSNLITKTNIFGSHNLALSSAEAQSFDQLTNAKKLINFFAFKSENGTLKAYENNINDMKFVIRGNTKYLNVFYAIQETKEPTVAANVFFQGLKVLAAFVPLFGFPSPTVITTKLTEIGGTQEPLNKLFAQFNESRTDLSVDELRTGTTIITTQFGSTNITVTAITDLEAGARALGPSFYDEIRPLGTAAGGTAALECPALRDTLHRDYQFSEKDQAFVLGLVAQTKHPGNRDLIMQCLATEQNARLVQKFDYNRKAPASNITVKQIVEHFKPNVITEANTKELMERWVNLLGLLNKPGFSRDAVVAELTRMAGNEPLVVEDRTYSLVPFGELANGAATIQVSRFVELLETKGLRRHGCITIIDPTPKKVRVLAIAQPEKPSKGEKFQLAELWGLTYAFKVTGQSAAVERIIVSNEVGFLRAHAAGKSCTADGPATVS